MFSGVTHQNSTGSINQEITNTEKEIVNIENEITNIENEIRESASHIVDVGPEPEWYHFIDRFVWKKQKEATETLKNKINGLKNIKTDKQRMLNLMKVQLKPTENILKPIWNSYIQPFLHLLFCLTLFLFSLNRFCRYLLIKDCLGDTKV